MRESTITDVAVYCCDTGMGRTFLFVRVRTTDGHWGTGEASQNDLDPAVAAAVDVLAEWLRERDVFTCIEPLARRLTNDRLGRHYWAAIGAIEQALWDLIGQFAGRPVHELLGGQVAELACYATISAGIQDHDPGALAAEAQRCIDLGFDGVKIVPDVEGASSYGPTDLARARVRSVREAIGPAPRLMIECAFGLDFDRAIEWADALEGENVYWFEAPLEWDDPRLLARLRSRINARVASGELVLGRRSARALIEQQAVSVLQPDVKWAGGILEVKKIAAWAETYQIQISPHNNSGPVASLASAHVAVTLPNLVAMELPSRTPAWQADLCGTDWGGDGPIRPEYLRSPGLGIRFDDRLARRLSP